MIIGVVGSIASGKSLLGDVLVKRGFLRLSFSAEVRNEAANKNISIKRKELQDLGNEMRLREGNDYWAKKVIAKMEKNKNYVVEGIRNPSEVNALRKLENFILVGVEAPIERRFQWIMMRQKDSDPSSLEGVKEIDARDRGIGEEGHGQQSAKCIEMADYHLINDKTKEHFQKKVDMLLKKMKIG